MKKISLFAAVIAFAAVFSGCSKNKSGPSTNASVMFVNGCPGSTGIYAKANGSNIGPGNIAVLHNSGYQNVAAGTADNINFYLQASGTPLCNGTTSLTAGSHYSVFAGGIVTASSFVVTADDLTAPASGNAKVRFINLGNDNLNESFYIGTQKIDSNIGYKQNTSFVQISATNNVAILAQDPSNAAPAYIAQLANQSFSAGRIYTIMLTGTYLGSGSSALTLTVINNN